MKGGNSRVNWAPVLPVALLYAGENETCIHICVRTNFMRITVIQANWYEMPEAPQRISYWAGGQQLASITEFGSEWRHSLVFESTALGIHQILGILDLPVISPVVRAKLINLNLSFLIYKIK